MGAALHFVSTHRDCVAPILLLSAAATLSQQVRPAGRVVLHRAASESEIGCSRAEMRCLYASSLRRPPLASSPVKEKHCALTPGGCCKRGNDISQKVP